MCQQLDAGTRLQDVTPLDGGREADRLLGDGKSILEVARHLEVSYVTYHRWRNQYGAMKADGVKRLKELERENQRLKAIVADQALECQALKEVAKGNW